jgi:uroporphyrinogen III methyltransferase/synthase
VTVYLVGAGPGDPGLLTVRGARLLGLADVVVYDRLVDPRLLELTRPDAELVYVGKAPGEVERTQPEIEALLVERGRTGETVVRLKGGDPFVFGRGGEEAEALAAANVPFEVVPGVTSAIAAPAYAGIPVTHRGVSTHFTVVTGHEDPTKGSTGVDWDALAKTGGTLVILMGAGRVRELADQLVEGGRAPSTPVAAVRHGTHATQQTIRATLGTIGDADVKAPSTIVVGDVAWLDFAWFERRPLFGCSIVVTRAREQASELRARLEQLGAEVIELPLIAIERVRFQLPAPDQYAWIVFTSTNGVRAYFDDGLALSGLDARALAGTRLAAIGPGTARALEAYGLRADLVPERFVAEALLDRFPVAVPGTRVLVAQAEQARDVLADGLAERGYEVDVLPVYRNVPAELDSRLRERVRAGNFDAVTFTSSSTVTNFCDLIGPIPDPQPSVVSIGPITSKTAVERGLRVDYEAEEHTIDGVVDAVVRVLGRLR